MKRYFSVLFALGMLSFLPAFAWQGNHQAVNGGVECGREYNCGQCPTICYQPYVTYKPRYYCTPRCVYKPEWKCKKCTTYENKECQRQKCRMVPEYYTETYCVKVPKCHYEWYCTQRKETVYDKCCEYIPCCKYRKVCYYNNECSPCANGSCPMPSGPNRRNAQGYYEYNRKTDLNRPMNQPAKTNSHMKSTSTAAPSNSTNQPNKSNKTL